MSGPVSRTAFNFGAEPRRVAIVRALRGLGDFLCIVPTLRALRAAWPKSSWYEPFEHGIDRVHRYFTWHTVCSRIARLYEHTIVTERGIRLGHRSQALLDRGFDDLVQTVRQARRVLRKPILEVAQDLIGGFAHGRKLMVCGNGGSAADAQHLAAELVGRFRHAARPGLPVVCLNADTSVLTAWSNDIGYEDVFARQVQALGKPGGMVLAVSTSGRSENVLRALQIARELGLQCFGLLGGEGGKALPLCDRALVVPSEDPQRIQEVHTLLLHLLCELIDTWAGTSDRVPSHHPPPASLESACGGHVSLQPYTNGSLEA